jgi:hypothetical protein
MSAANESSIVTNLRSMDITQELQPTLNQGDVSWMRSKLMDAIKTSEDINHPCHDQARDEHLVRFSEADRCRVPNVGYAEAGPADGPVGRVRAG